MLQGAPRLSGLQQCQAEWPCDAEVAPPTVAFLSSSYCWPFSGALRTTGSVMDLALLVAHLSREVTHPWG
jgi:hypothetical protein